MHHLRNKIVAALFLALTPMVAVGQVAYTACPPDDDRPCIVLTTNGLSFVREYNFDFATSERKFFQLNQRPVSVTERSATAGLTTAPVFQASDFTCERFPIDVSGMPYVARVSCSAGTVTASGGASGAAVVVNMTATLYTSSSSHRVGPSGSPAQQTLVLPAYSMLVSYDIAWPGSTADAVMELQLTNEWAVPTEENILEMARLGVSPAKYDETDIKFLTSSNARGTQVSWRTDTMFFAELQYTDLVQRCAAGQACVSNGGIADQFVYSQQSHTPKNFQKVEYFSIDQVVPGAVDSKFTWRGSQPTMRVEGVMFGDKGNWITDRHDFNWHLFLIIGTCVLGTLAIILICACCWMLPCCPGYICCANCRANRYHQRDSEMEAEPVPQPRTARPKKLHSQLLSPRWPPAEPTSPRTTGSPVPYNQAHLHEPTTGTPAHSRTGSPAHTRAQSPARSPRAGSPNGGVRGASPTAGASPRRSPAHAEAGAV